MKSKYNRVSTEFRLRNLDSSRCIPWTGQVRPGDLGLVINGWVLEYSSLAARIGTEQAVANRIPVRNIAPGRIRASSNGGAIL